MYDLFKPITRNWGGPDKGVDFNSAEATSLRKGSTSAWSSTSACPSPVQNLHWHDVELPEHEGQIEIKVLWWDTLPVGQIELRLRLLPPANSPTYQSDIMHSLML